MPQLRWVAGGLRTRDAPAVHEAERDGALDATPRTRVVVVCLVAQQIVARGDVQGQRLDVWPWVLLVHAGPAARQAHPVRLPEPADI